MTTKQVLGKKTQVLRERYAHCFHGFACGFAVGQAEKVYLGVCSAAMLRVSPEYFDWYLGEVKAIASHFDLDVTVLDSHCEETPQEIWVHRCPIGDWLQYEVNSEMWHMLRAGACGIPLKEVDTKYHLRDGYGKRCD